MKEQGKVKRGATGSRGEVRGDHGGKSLGDIWADELRQKIPGALARHQNGAGKHTSTRSTAGVANQSSFRVAGAAI